MFELFIILHASKVTTYLAAHLSDHLRIPITNHLKQEVDVG